MKLRKLRKLFRKIPLRTLLGFLLFVALLTGSLIGGGWVYGKLLNRQAFGLLSRAEADFSGGNLTEAKMGAETALRIKPDLLGASRLLARIQTKTGDTKGALKTLQGLAERGGLSLDELRIYSSLAFQNGEDELAVRLAALAGAHGDSAFPHLIAAQISLRDSKLDEAERSFREAVDADTNDATRAFLVDFLLSARRNTSAEEISSIIKDFSTRDSQLGALALAAGIQTGIPPRDELKHWVEALRSHKHANIGQRLLAGAAAVSLDPSSKPQVVSDLLAHAAPLPLRERLLVAEWFSRNGEPSGVVSLLPLQEAVTQSGAFMLWLDAVSAQGNWTLALEGLSRPDNPLPPHASNLFRGIALKRIGDNQGAHIVFRKAISEAGSDPEKSALVVSYLLSAEELDLFEEVFPRVSENRLNAHALYATLYPAVAARRDAALSLRVLEALSLSGLLAQDAAFQNELAYYQILFGKTADLEGLRERRKADPNNLPALATLALYELKSGAPRTAKAIFDSFGPDVDARLLPPRIIAIFSATLAANGDLVSAKKAASIIPPDAFSPAEESLLGFPRSGSKSP